MAGNTRPSKKKAPVAAETAASPAEIAVDASAAPVPVDPPFKSKKPAPVESEPVASTGGSTPPRRGTVTPAKAAVKKAAAPEPAPVTAAVPKKAKVTEVDGSPVKLVEVEGEGQRFVFEMVDDGVTKNYARFAVPDGSGCQGKLYFPLGTTWVRIAFGAGE